MAKASGGEPRQPDGAPALGPGRARAESRGNSFMKSALAILGETGRTDFTVLEVVERSKTSLRAFYQHFATKDELLLALIDKIMSESTERWRAETSSLTATDALRRIVQRLSAPASSSTQEGINRGLTFYNDHLQETKPREFARVLEPLHDLIRDILRRGIADGSFRSNIEVDTAAAIFMQTALGAMRLRNLSRELTGVEIDSDAIYDFCVHGLAS
ncbi:TetR/AcrR family transcriptional regulator [Mycolicibacterium komossense]|uniref:TetR/AcrR family transcriptional regulator n=1 Tax=Mycolicibacterium komossense TaxID=1779 RepID=A0ABT3CC00_9MYCO|nr:TetR/AcrR family transcriptional regulator [Mycolicibacterium komossense]MCV7226993.1 TetR/AcrR family transcriptional regulator [Mycolicibacterium komossense]